MSLAAVPKSRYLLFFALAIFGCGLDLWTKSWAFARLGMPGSNPPHWIVPNVFGWETSLNEGALFGIGQGMAPVFAMLSGLVFCGVLYWLFWAGGAADRLLTIALGMITGGIFGNLYDRLGLHGLEWPMHLKPQSAGEPVYAVRDWILMQAGPRWTWPNYNIADALLVCGVGLLVCHALFCQPSGEEADQPAAAQRRAIG